MKLCFKISLISILIITCLKGQAQDEKSTQERMASASKYMLQQNYTEAINIYKEILTVDSENIQANYNIAVSLNGVHKGLDAIPYLEKVLKLDAGNFRLGDTYNFLGGIYDWNNMPEKAIAAFEAGIKILPNYRPLYSNLATVNFKVKNYAAAETNAIKALKLEPKSGSSMRVYALVAFHQNKRAAALLGLCDFLLLEPTGPKSTEAFGNIQNIFTGGALKTEPGQKAIKTEPITEAQNAAIKNALKSFANRHYASAGDLLAAQLTAIFKSLSALPKDKNEFYDSLANYFLKLSQTEHMPAFARVISQSTRPENATWLTDNADKVAAYDTWVKINKLTL